MKRLTSTELLILVAVGGITLSLVKGGCQPTRSPHTTVRDATPPEPPSPPVPEPPGPPSARDARRLATIAEQLRPATSAWRDGLAAVVLVDVSGSMSDRVRNAGGERERKMAIAQRATIDLVRAFEAYARAHPNEVVAVGVFEFSARGGQPDARVVVAPGPPDAAAARGPIEAMRPRGGTNIGDAMIEARRALDATGLRRRHLLVVTDGENTNGVAPELVARVMEQQGDADRAPLYFVAFDVDAEAFAAVKQHGGLVLPARDGRELATTFEELLSDRILVEAPRSGVEKPRGEKPQ